MAVTETIQELLQGIDDAQYGRDMRQYIHKGIQKCYEEGRAGETDLDARDRLDVVEQELYDSHNWSSVACELQSDYVEGLSDQSGAEVLVNELAQLAMVKLSLTVTGTIAPGTVIVKQLPMPRTDAFFTIIKPTTYEVKCGAQLFGGVTDGQIRCGQLDVPGSALNSQVYLATVIYHYYSLYQNN
jgi:hypothetical protein